MVAQNFPRSLRVVWSPGLDCPLDGYHVTPGDPGKGTSCGITEATWRAAVEDGIVIGELEQATTAQAERILHARCWAAACDVLPDGLDLMVFNGRMMTGRYPWLFQQCIGFDSSAVDGVIGHKTLAAAIALDVVTLIMALHGTHYAYLRALPGFDQFGRGWAMRLALVRNTAIAMFRTRDLSEF